MENMKLALMKRIREEVPEIATIDEDYGQLESEDDQYPVVFPAVLINADGTEWQTLNAGQPALQRGSASFSLKLAIDCYDDTHIGSSTEDRILERDALNERIFNAVQGFKVESALSAIVRVRSREYSLGGGLKVYETTFSYGSKWSAANSHR